MSPPRNVLALEPWLGGSHEQFLDQWRARSRHTVRIVGLPARHWKWRMRSSAWELARELARTDAPIPDVLLVSDYVDLPALRGWSPAGWREVPCVLYVHEDQLTYPSAPIDLGHANTVDDERDHHYGFTNVLTCVAADQVVFNSAYHRDVFAAAADTLLAHLPRPNPRATLTARLEASAVIGPGVDLDEIALGPGGAQGTPLRVLFNHRWEHDKDPVAFLAAVAAARDRGAALELVLLGERFEDLPEGTAQALERVRDLVAHQGFAASRSDYGALLGTADVVVSTARHEYFGISVVEGMAAGCAPLCPARLSYPEVVPEARRSRGLYADDEELVGRLVDAASQPAAFRVAEERRALRASVEHQDARATADALDSVVDRLAERHSG